MAKVKIVIETDNDDEFMKIAKALTSIDLDYVKRDDETGADAPTPKKKSSAPAAEKKPPTKAEKKPAEKKPAEKKPKAVTDKKLRELMEAYKEAHGLEALQKLLTEKYGTELASKLSKADKAKLAVDLVVE